MTIIGSSSGNITNCTLICDDGSNLEVLASQGHKVKRHARVNRVVCQDAWVMMPDKLALLCEVVDRRLSVPRAEHEQFDKVDPPEAEQHGSIAVLPLFGVIAPRMNMINDISGGTSAEGFGKMFDAAVNDEDVSAIIIDIDSPGGQVAGIQEIADKVFAARDVKPIVAVANPLAASGAFWIATAATTFVVTPSGEVGSVGVIASHIDVSKADKMEGIERTFITSSPFKAEGGETLTDEAVEFIQGQVDKIHAKFVAGLARNRGVTAAHVEANFGQGRVLLADDAIAAGMVDRIDTLEGEIARIQEGAGRLRLRVRQ